MSNLLKSKFFLGFMVLAAVVVAGAGVADAYTHTVTLKMGSTGSQVMSLQQTLNGSGYVVSAAGAGSPGMESTYFGAKTKAAVMAFQAAHGLTADGVVGPMTGAALSGMGGSYPAGCTSSSGYSSTTGKPCSGGSSNLPAGCASSSGYSPTTGAKCDGSGSSTAGNGTLGNGDGDIKDVNEVSSDDSKYTEGETSELFAFEAEIEGDVEIDRVDFFLDTDESSGNQSDNADDYFGAAVLMLNGKKVATLDVDDWDEDSYGKVSVVTGDNDEYRLRFSDLGLVFKDGDEPEFTLAFEVNKSIDSGDLTETWGVELENDSIRFVDGRGFSDDAGANLSETFSGASEEAAELRIKNSSNDPDATTIEVSDTGVTKEVTVFKFDIQERNDIDVTINDLGITITTGSVTGTVDEGAVVTDAFLYEGSKLLGSESVATGGDVTFENIGLDIDAGDTAELTVKLSFADANDYATGTDVKVAITSNDIEDAEDANGNDEGDMNINGSATSELHSLRQEGVIVTFDDSSYTKTTSDTSGVNETVEFTLEFDVTAFGDDIYVDKSCAVHSSPASTYTTAVVVSLDGDTDGSSTTCTDFDSTGDEENNSFEVLEGQTEHFTVTILGNGGEAGGAGTSVTFTARLEAIGFKVGSDGQGDSQYAFNLQDFKSKAVTVFDR